MKRTISILLTALVAFGCAKEELAVPETSGNTEVSSGVDMSSINFAIKNGLENWGTKASVVDGFATGDAISVAAFQNTNVCFNDAITNTTDGWVMSGERHYYWESYNAEYNGTDALDFCFVYPEQTISSKSFTYTLGANPASQEDLLVKYLAGTKASADYSPVEVVMDHALSILDFKVKAEESGYEYKVEGITVNNAAGFYDKGTYTFGSGWGSLSKVNSVNSISSPINVATVSSSEYTDVNDGDYCFVLPQDVASMGINVRYSVFKNGTTYTDTKSVSLSDNTFAAGKKYTYKITIPAISTATLPTPNVYVTVRGNNYLVFEWDSVAGATKYEVSTNNGATYTNVDDDLKFTWSGLNANEKYTIFVRALDGNGGTSDVATCTAKTNEADLGTPMIISTDVTTNSIIVTWSDVQNAEYYLISLDDSNLSNPTRIESWQGPVCRFSGLAQNTTHTVYIKAYNNNSQKSDIESKEFTTASALSESVLWTGWIQHQGVILNANNTEFEGNDYNGKTLRITYYMCSNNASSSAQLDITTAWTQPLASINVSRSLNAQTIDIKITGNIRKQIQQQGLAVNGNSNEIYVARVEIL